MKRKGKPPPTWFVATVIGSGLAIGAVLGTLFMIGGAAQ